jgi:peptidoglycan/LPS O-acetylase OafA/YrhL
MTVTPSEIRPPHAPALDGLRGVAILIVLLSHASNNGFNFAPWLNFGGIGRYGVFLFFVLSAYLLTRQCLRATNRELVTGRFWGRYLLRRLLRIYPLYSVALLAYWFESRRGLSPYPETGRSVLQALALRNVDYVFWTIPVEFGYYLLLPIAVAIAVVLKRRVWPTAAVFLVAGGAAGMVWPPRYESAVWPFLPIFLCGSFAAVLGQSSGKTRRKFAVPAGWIALLFPILLTPHLFNFLTRSRVPFDRFHLWFLPFGVAWTLVLLGVVHGPGRLRSIFEGNVVRFWGRISFSAYLIHLLVMKRLSVEAPGLPPALGTAVFFTVVGVASWISYRLVERPAMRLWSTGAAPANIRQPQPLPIGLPSDPVMSGPTFPPPSTPRSQT